jgi:hypothetical protein
VKRFSIVALCVGILLLAYVFLGLALTKYADEHYIKPLFACVSAWSLILLGWTGLLAHKILDRLPREPEK